jgi:hypothetical protein
VSAPANCQLIGRWRIVEADIWDRDHLGLCGPAMITITDHGRGEIASGALQAGLDLEYSRSSIGFTWEGFDEMDEVSGDGSAELLDDGTIEIEFAYRNGDEAVLKAKRDSSSTASKFVRNCLFGNCSALFCSKAIAPAIASALTP